MKRKSKVPRKQPKVAEKPPVQIYTLEVLLLISSMSSRYVERKPTVSRTIQILGDQTLEDLHGAIFHAFERWDEHMYEFQFGKGPEDRKALKFVMPEVFEDVWDSAMLPAGRVDLATLDSLNLTVRDRFYYLFDFGDEWWHKIKVKAIEEAVPTGEYPRVINKVGKCPPQYADDEDDDEYDWGDDEDE